MSINEKVVSILTKTVISNNFIRNLTAKHFEKMLYKNIVENGENTLYSKNAKIEVFNGVNAMYLSILNNLNKGIISTNYAKRMIETLVPSMLGGGKDAIQEFKEKYGRNPPVFITIGPTKKCNLNCTGCYASSKANNAETLDWKTVNKIIKEGHDKMGMRFFVITGGEPMLYKSEGKNILDLARKWNDCFFLMYTNGILITKSVAEELNELGNLTPAISVEGYEKGTDERRGKGVYKKILVAMQNLKQAGVPFGTSVTATSKNINTLLTDEFYEHYFNKLGSTYMWIFQYMPIGRKFTTKLMITPKQRQDLFKKWRSVLSEKKWFVADFWNSALLSGGCISCGKGYLYIDWNGNIMPCVFIPYYKHNINKLYSENKNMIDALFSDFFVNGRKWQEGYFNQNGKLGNMLRPCFIRDHHKEFLKIARETNVLPEDEAAKQAMEDENYHKELFKFDEELKKIQDPLWEKEYAKKNN